MSGFEDANPAMIGIVGFVLLFGALGMMVGFIGWLYSMYRIIRGTAGQCGWGTWLNPNRHGGWCGKRKGHLWDEHMWTGDMMRAGIKPWPDGDSK